MPEEATPLQRAQLLAALSVGTEIIMLRHAMRQLDLTVDVSPAFAAVAEGKSAAAIEQLARLDAALATRSAIGAAMQTLLRARASILVLLEVLTEHADYFNAGARA